MGGLWVEDRIECELAESCFDITWRRRSIPRESITPVTLAVNEQVLLSELHECISDAGITMRVILHGLTYDVGYLVVLTVINALHRVQDTTLHRLKTILDCGDGTL